MNAPSQQQAKVKNECLDLLLEAKDLEDVLDEHESAPETKASKESIKTHIVEPMNAFIGRVNQMTINQRTYQARHSERLTLEAQ